MALAQASQGSNQGIGWAEVISSQLGEDPLPDLHGGWQNSVSCWLFSLSLSLPLPLERWISITVDIYMQTYLELSIYVYMLISISNYLKRERKGTQDGIQSFFFYGLWKFPGQGSNPRHSCDLSVARD